MLVLLSEGLVCMLTKFSRYFNIFANSRMMAKGLRHVGLKTPQCLSRTAASELHSQRSQLQHTRDTHRSAPQTEENKARFFASSSRFNTSPKMLLMPVHQTNARSNAICHPAIGKDLGGEHGLLVHP